MIILDYSADNPPALTDIWHADETFREAPPMATILRAKVVPETGGDTMFASMSAAYRGLSERMQQHIHGLEALHDFKPWRPLFGETDRPSCASSRTIFPIPGTPSCGCIRCRGGACSTSTGSSVASRASRATRATRCWSSSTTGHDPRIPAAGELAAQHLVMWDNRSVQHYALHDYYPRGAPWIA